VNAESPSRDVVRRALDPRSKPTPSEEVKLDPPLHWPTITPMAAEREWPELRRWVDELRQRYPGVDSYVVPACWYEHASLVVALQALKDHERVAYATTSPASAGTDWHRAFRDLAALLRQFTADLRCGHGPEYVDPATFDDFAVGDIARRRRRAATVALGRPETFTG
jgi:hypothetical protein